MKLGAAVFTVALGALSLLAQTETPLKGDFVLTEEGAAANGAPFAALARLTIGTDGTVTGSWIARDVTYDVQGVYTAGAAGTGTLSLTASAANGDGDTVTLPLNYQLVRPKAGGAVLVRSNPGIFAAGSLSPAAAPANLAGTWFFSEEGLSRPSARLAVLTLDSAGGITGYQIVNSVNVSGRLDLKGSWQTGAQGFTRVTFSVSTTDENGDTVDSSETWTVLADQSGLKALRAGTDSARVIDLEK